VVAVELLGGVVPAIGILTVAGVLVVGAIICVNYGGHVFKKSWTGVKSVDMALKAGAIYTGWRIAKRVVRW